MWDILYSVWLYGLYCIDSLNAYTFFPGSLVFNRVINGNIKSNATKKESITIVQYCKIMKEWAIQNMTEKTISHHWWYEELPKIQKDIFDVFTNHESITSSINTIFDFKTYAVEPLYGMKEVYITGKNRSEEEIHSDHVFFTPHIDGPFLLFPFVSVYRVLVGMNSNTEIETIFPMIQYSHTINTCDFIGFDFNREVHYIESKESEQEEPRVTLKLHYVIYPHSLYYYGKFIGYLNEEYNRLFRKLFLHTIKPTNLVEYLNSYIIVISTNLFYIGELYIGYRNIAYICLLMHFKHTYNLSDNTINLLLGLPVYYKILSPAIFKTSTKNIEIQSYIRDIILFYSLFLCNIIV